MNQESTGQVEPIFVTVKDAATILGLSPYSMGQLLRPDDSGVAPIKSVKQGGRRSVSMASLREYAAGLLESA